MLDHYNQTNPKAATEKDLIPLLYLGVALSKTEAKEEAVAVLEEALNEADKRYYDTGPRNVLWARAHLSRLLRSMNRQREAKQQADKVGYVPHPCHHAP